MDNIAQTSMKSSNSSTVSIDVQSDNNILMRLRRLKIAESLLSKSINKSMKAHEGESEIFLSNANYKEFVTKVKNTYMDINILFCDVKANTCSQDNLKIVDIDDVKGDVIELEAKIKALKSFLNSELTLLKNKEQELQKQVHENPVTIIDNIRRKRKISSKPYSEIVPSPVKTLIKSPFKCPEVQQFQDFMANSKNRYGGWNAYSHNIFETSWQKYFSVRNDGDGNEYRELNFENSDLFPLFIREVLHKIPGLTSDDILLHNRWYSKYISLKKSQERALAKWKANKKIIKKVNFKTQAPHGTTTKEDICEKGIEDRSVLNTLDKFKEMDKLLSDKFNIKTTGTENMINEKYKLYDNVIEEPKNNVYNETDITLCAHQKLEENNKHNKVSGFLKPTAQWNNRCQNIQEYLSLPNNINVEKISKRQAYSRLEAYIADGIDYTLVKLINIRKITLL